MPAKQHPAISAYLVHASEHIRVIGRLHFLVRSKTDKNDWHCVDLEWVDDDWPAGGCTCQGFQARKECRHVAVVLEILGLDKPTQVD